MCDFSRYGVPSEEWVRLEATLPTTQNENQSLVDLKTTTNAAREAVARKEMESLSSKVSIQSHSLPMRDGFKLEVRSYRPTTAEPNEALSIYVHFHGGGFLFGTLSSEDATCSRIAINAGVLVINVNYRHTPEYTYPIAWNDSEDALGWIVNNAASLGGDRDSLIIGGISAGASLTAALVQMALKPELDIQKPFKIRGQVLMIPALVLTACYESQMRQIKDASVSSYQQCAEAPILPSRRRTLFHDLVKIEHPNSGDKRMNPGLVTPEAAKQLPPTTLGVAGNDPLRDEGLLYGKLLAENG
jgi:acetyl esterase/lipase